MTEYFALTGELDKTLSDVPFTMMIRTPELAEPYRRFHEQLARVC